MSWFLSHKCIWKSCEYLMGIIGVSFVCVLWNHISLEVNWKKFLEGYLFCSFVIPNWTIWSFNVSAMSNHHHLLFMINIIMFHWATNHVCPLLSLWRFSDVKKRNFVLHSIDYGIAKYITTYPFLAIPQFNYCRIGSTNISSGCFVFFRCLFIKLSLSPQISAMMRMGL